MGAKGRAHVLAQFTWPQVIQQYQAVWREQDLLRREHAARAGASKVQTPVPFPDVEYAFASYPSEWLSADARVVAADDAGIQLERLLGLPIASYLPNARIVDPATLSAILHAAEEACSLSALETVAEMSESSLQRRRATLAWLLKYDLLRVVQV